MSEEKFTPGPWKAHRMRVYLPDRQNPLNVGFNERTVDNACANAALIAAAPEMYNELKTVRKIIECEEYRDDCERIDRILKKARGEE